MMKPLLFSCIAILLSVTAFTQEKTFSIQGKIMDAKSGSALAGASVFCQNTTSGTISSNDGLFSLRMANGGYDLVISYTGYETQVLRISNSSKDKDSLNILLKEEDKSMTEVVVTGGGALKDGWARYGDFFLENFIGTSNNATQCTIMNKDALQFYYYKKSNRLKVKAKEQLLIVNEALGYKIHYQLDSFVNHYDTHISSYTGYPLFEELTGTPEQQELWKKNRYLTYIGSRLHFMRSWYDSTLKDEGFEIEILDSANPEKGTLLENPYDSSFYSLDSGTVDISLKGRIRIKYKNRVPDKAYLIKNKFPLTARIQISALDIPNGFSIEENGYFYEQSEVTNMGYWAWKKLAELVPYDYNPE
ncbi:MAG: carboxypeptidase-like regulatory domain-containing protein [Bacteroidota bacterium]|nr:carboxypeptidase-like regulatory domain-containing protein [Bacteroidota bacterium]